MTWLIKNLEEVCDLVGGGTPSKSNAEFYTGDIPWATVRDMKNEKLIETECQITKQAVANSSTNIIGANNVVIATRVGLGKVCILQQDTAINQDLKAVIPKNKILNKRYLFYWFKTIADFIVSSGTGATVQGVKLSFIKSLKLPLPSFSEQKRIVAILDQAFADIDKARANAEQNLKNARELFDSYLQQVFSQGNTDFEATVGDMAEHKLGKMLDKKKNKGELKPYLRNLSVRWFDFDLDNILEMRFQNEEIDRYSVRKGDLLICEGGYPGRAAIWDRDETIYYQKALHRVRFHNAVYNKWLLYYLYFNDSTGAIKSHFTGAGIQHFTGKALGKMSLMFPPPDEVSARILKIEKLLNKVQALEAVYISKLVSLEQLKKSLLQKAFSGELTQNKKLVA